MLRSTFASRLLVGFAALPLFAGCTMSRKAQHPLSAADLALVRKEVEGRSATVAFAPTPTEPTPAGAYGGKTYVDPDVVRVLERDGEHRVALAQVREINANHAARGALVGAVAGFGAGALLVYTASYLRGDDCGSSSCHGYDGATWAFAILAGAVGVLVGMPIGAAMDAGPVWRFSPATSP
jgi:hypothetical protein